jgi:hypothetical protein
MQKVTLKFKSGKQLWEFKQQIRAQDVEINLRNCTLTCHCSEKEISLAIVKFGAEAVPGSSE